MMRNNHVISYMVLLRKRSLKLEFVSSCLEFVAVGSKHDLLTSPKQSYRADSRHHCRGFQTKMSSKPKMLKGLSDVKLTFLSFLPALNFWIAKSSQLFKMVISFIDVPIEVDSMVSH